MEERTGLSHRHRAAAGREGEHAAPSSLNLSLSPLQQVPGLSLLRVGCKAGCRNHRAIKNY